MKTLVTTILATALLAATLLPAPGRAAELKPAYTYKGKDLEIALLTETGRFTTGKNALVVEVRSAVTGQLADAGRVSLSTSMVMPGMAPMIDGATLAPDRTPGRYAGSITFADAGSRQATVSWEGPAGRGQARFSLAVR